MPTYLLADNSLDNSFSFTGIVEPKLTWTENEDGRRIRSDVQEVDADGTPLWLVSTTRLTENYGRLSETVANVTVPSDERPKVRRHQQANFLGLIVDVRVNRNNGQIVENFSAAGILND